ncbi:GGDEF domain-containing protein [Luteimonas deserti]|uniref:diguanylate cyclase n=1 Tax=Luteimonas deserti TaxID=2752306 RepID=A0A7Z0QUB4_9GAMM|nr:GGDEF domain-containing protein [Luteimonas deserti]NYZ63977.1 diguanylate cyclase [Luteimonas deserti]
MDRRRRDDLPAAPGGLGVRQVVARLRENFRLAIISLLGVTTAVALGGFMVWRLTRGDWMAAGFDGLVMLGILAVVGLAWREGRTELAGTLMVVCNSLFCAAAWSVVGAAANGWVYVALMTNFYIARTRVAVWASVFLLAASMAALVTGDGPYHLSTPVTWLLIFAFSYAFSRRVSAHSDSLEQRANRDPLTQMPNRGALETCLESIVRRRRRGTSGLLILDIDRFKLVNDEFGHPAGDRVLLALADVLREELRQGDSVFRFGGEEFVLVLPSGSEATLAAAGERLREAVAARVAGPAGPITVSIGGAMYCGELDWQDWFARADASLYLSKRAGRNRVHVAHALEEPVAI